MKSPKEKEIKPNLPKPLEPAMNEAERNIAEIIRGIKRRLNSQVDKAADKTAQLTTAGELKLLFKNAAKEQTKIAFNNVENLVLAGLSLIPVFGEIEGGAVAIAELADAAKLEGATLEQANALAKGAEVNVRGGVCYPLIKVLGIEGAKRLNKVLKAIDPYPNIPAVVTLASGGAELMGIHGATAIPSAAQLLVNEFKTIALGAKTALKAGQIILKSPQVRRMHEFGSSVLSTLDARIQAVTSPRVSQAAHAFA